MEIMIYNIDFDLCAVVISVISLFFILLKKGLQRESNRLLFYIILASLASAVFDIWSSFGNSHIRNYSDTYRDILNFLFLFLHTSTSCLFAWYILVLLGLHRHLSRWKLCLFLLPEVFGIFLPLALNPLFRWVFYYDAAGIYCHACMIYLLYFCGYLYMLFSIYLLLRHRKLLVQSQHLIALGLLIFGIVPIIVQQFFFPHQLLELFFQSIGIFGYLLAIENLDDIYDFSTRTYNRVAFLRDTAHLLSRQEPFRVLIVKLSRPSYLEIALSDLPYSNGFIASIAEYLHKLYPQQKIYHCTQGHLCLLQPLAENYPSTEKALTFPDTHNYRNQEFSVPLEHSRIDVPNEATSLQEILCAIELPYDPQEIPARVTAGELPLDKLSPEENPSHRQFTEEMMEMLSAFIGGAALLTPAEWNVFQYYIDKREISEIPSLAFISINTVRKHNKSIYRKLSVSTREELLLYLDLLRRSHRLEELYRACHQKK